MAHHDLARQGIGLRQQPVQVASQQNFVGRAQVGHPGLQVVRVRRQNRIAQQPASHILLRVGVATRPLPGFDRFRRHARAAGSQPGRRHGGRGNGTAASNANEVATLHGACL